MGSSRSNNSCSCYFSNMLNAKILIFSFILYLINQKILKLINYTFFKYYFNDLLAPIILLSYSNFFLNFYNKTIKGKNIYIFISICGIFWEVITPLLKKDSVGDIMDFAMYILGASIYMILVKGVERWKKITNDQK